MTATLDPVSGARRGWAWCLAVAVFLLGACSGRPAPPQTGPAAGASAAAADDTGVQPGDALLLRVWQEPGMSDTLRVDEDGRVVFPLLGARSVTGIPADSLRRRVVSEYGEYVKGSVEVTVLRRISVLGAVRRPGLYPVDLTFSLADALARAGGMTPHADRDDIRLVRDGRVVRHSLERARSVASLPVRSGDQIVVGEQSWFARNWQWLAGTVVSASVLVLTR